MNGYDLSRKWFNFSFENPDKIKPVHTAIYFFACEHCNRLGGKEKFGFPSQMTMEAIGVKSYTTYGKALKDLVRWGFIVMVEESKNQYSANIISIGAVSKNDKARDKALDKATIKHVVKHCQSTSQSIVSIDKPLTKEPLTINQQQINKTFSFRKSMCALGLEKSLVDDFLKNRKLKRLANTETAFNNLVLEFNKNEIPMKELMTKIVSSGWGSFKNSWLEEKKEKNVAPKKENAGIALQRQMGLIK